MLRTIPAKKKSFFSECFLFKKVLVPDCFNELKCGTGGVLPEQDFTVAWLASLVTAQNEVPIVTHFLLIFPSMGKY